MLMLRTIFVRIFERIHNDIGYLASCECVHLISEVIEGEEEVVEIASRAVLF